MSQDITIQPNLKPYSKEEIKKMSFKAVELLTAGHKEEAQKLINEIPLHWKSADMLKETYGIKVLIEKGINLSEAVNHYGRQWLDN